jgi:hypothetical protein
MPGVIHVFDIGEATTMIDGFLRILDPENCGEWGCDSGGLVSEKVPFQVSRSDLEGKATQAN